MVGIINLDHNTQHSQNWHAWWAWHPVFVPNPDSVSRWGYWVWCEKIFRRIEISPDGTFQGSGHWQYCLNEFELLRLAAYQVKRGDISHGGYII